MAASRQHASDLELFLRLRAAEMPEGAALVFGLGGRPTEPVELQRWQSG